MLTRARSCFAAMIFAALAITPLVHAQTYEVLHNFAPIAGGEFPLAGVTRDAAGNLYGTTSEGGTGTVCGNPLGCGTVFTISTAGVESVLYSFTGGADGSYPSSGVIRDATGNLYGETSTGGTTQRGTVFKVDSTGAETVLYSFQGNSDGAFPTGGLLRDSAGNLYGTTQAGGASGNGTVFKLDPSGRKIVLHNFAGAPSDGAVPVGNLVRDSAGTLYGSTENGGSSACALTSQGCGVVYKLDTTGQETVIYSFSGGLDGGIPRGGLLRDASGNLYGTTSAGGTPVKGTGFGIVFKIDSSGAETVLHSFGAGSDGMVPSTGVLLDGKGNLYGTALSGGTGGHGIVFRLDRAGQETVLHSFLGRPDGAEPQGTLTMDGAGNLYGTATNEGHFNAGIVFEIKR